MLGLCNIVLLIIVVCCSRLSLIYVTRLYATIVIKSTCLSHPNCVYRINLLAFDQPFIPRAVSIKFDPLGPLVLPSVKSNLLLDWLNMNDLVGKTCLRIY
jgi:hypothetical protein